MRGIALQSLSKEIADSSESGAAARELANLASLGKSTDIPTLISSILRKDHFRGMEVRFVASFAFNTNMHPDEGRERARAKVMVRKRGGEGVKKGDSI